MPSSKNSLYILWDESHLWGVMLIRALKQLRLPFKIITSQDVKAEILADNSPAGLIIPGGWAKLKARNLTEQGLKNIRDYVENGGRYLGFCGGAGLALQGTSRFPGLNLCPWGRKSFKERLPNFSGHILCKIAPWSSDSQTRSYLPVWWPSQFKPVPEKNSIKIMASYLSPGPDFWASDLSLSNVTHDDLLRWESIYGINLNPALLMDEPCIIQGDYGGGRYILSYSHLETPHSPEANRLLYSILAEWTGNSMQKKNRESFQAVNWDLQTFEPVWDNESLLNAWQSMNEIIQMGQNQFLFAWRSPWLLGWKRGIPGSFINFLYAMICQALTHTPDTSTKHFWQTKEKGFRQEISIFSEKLKNYLGHERLAIATSPSSPESSSDYNLQQQKIELFGSFPGYGGLYGNLIRTLDTLIYKLEIDSQ